MRTFRSIALSALLLASTATVSFANGDGSGFALPTSPASEQRNGDGSGFARPTSPASDRANNGDGSGFTVPTVPGSTPSDVERWV